MRTERYENRTCNIDTKLLKDDEYTFSVLIRILDRECRLTITDNKQFIICHSAHPYPVWVWLSQNASMDTYEQVYCILKEEFLCDQSLKFNAGYDFADYVIKRSCDDGITVRISMNMLAYRCLNPIPPHKKAAGSCVLATNSDIELAANFEYIFHNDTGIEKLSMKECVDKVSELIESNRLFFWCDENWEKVAMASYGVSGDKGNVGNVFTRHDKRRRGYAANLVHAITMMILESGKIPTLYTDADYSASNACYEEIGYTKMGSLCTVEQC